MRKFYLFFCRYVLVLLFLFVTAAAWSQSKTVTGKVTSEDDGAGIPGANVLEKGTSNGTVTDATGSYSITRPQMPPLSFPSWAIRLRR